MTKKLKVPTSGKGGKDTAKKKSDYDHSEGKKSKSNRNLGQDNQSHPPTKPSPSVARQRWNMPSKFWDSTLTKLRIQFEPRKYQQARPVKPVVMQSYCVKRCERIAKQPEAIYVVSKKVPEDTESDVWFPEKINGLRFDKNQPVAHSILGSLDEYLNEARRRNLVREPPLAETARPSFNKYTPLPKIPTKPEHLRDLEYVFSAKFKQDNSLQIWEDENVKRRKLANSIAKKSTRNPRDLIMGNHPYKISRGEERKFENPEDAWKAECRKTKSNGFFKERELLGDEERGIHTSLTKTEQGEEPDAVLIFRTGSGRRSRGDKNIPDLENQPEFSNFPQIFVEYCSPDIPQFPAEIPYNLMEPVIKIGDHILRWSNRQNNIEVEMGIMAVPGEAKMADLEIRNIGCCVVRYQLFKLEKQETFNILQAHTDNFFVDDSEGIVLPAETDFISTIFRSRKAGTFSEKWRIETIPKLARNIILTIWGIAKDVEVLGDKGELVEKELEENIRQNFIDTILDEVITKICCETLSPRREGFPKHAQKFFTKTPAGVELFSSVNPGLVYHSGVISQIQQIAQVSIPECRFDSLTLPLNVIRKSLCELPEEIEFQKEVIPRNELANIFMAHVRKLSYTVSTPTVTEKYDMCKTLLLGLCNQICDSASRLKKVHGITIDMDFEIEISKDEPRIEAPPKNRRSKSSLKSPSRETKHKKRSSTQSAPSPRESPREVPRESPPSPTPNRFGKIVKSINSAKKSQYKNRVRPLMYVKYLEKLYTSSYIILQSTIDTISLFLADMEDKKPL